MGVGQGRVSFSENNKEKLLSYSYKTKFGREVALMLDELNKDIALKTEAWKNEMDERARKSELKHAKEFAKKEGREEVKFLRKPLQDDMDFAWKPFFMR